MVLTNFYWFTKKPNILISGMVCIDEEFELLFFNVFTAKTFYNVPGIIKFFVQYGGYNTWDCFIIHSFARKCQSLVLFIESMPLIQMLLNELTLHFIFLKGYHTLPYLHKLLLLRENFGKNFLISTLLWLLTLATVEILSWVLVENVIVLWFSHIDASYFRAFSDLNKVTGIWKHHLYLSNSH